MSYAIVCDKCGKVYTKSEDKELLVLVKTYKYRTPEYSMSDAEEYHLCPVCYSMFNSFISNIHKKEEQDDRKCYSCRWYEGDTGETPVMCMDCSFCPGQTRSVVYNNYEEEA